MCRCVQLAGWSRGSAQRKGIEIGEMGSEGGASISTQYYKYQATVLLNQLIV